MQRLPSKGKSAKPPVNQNARSFTRYESVSASPTTRSRANTAQEAPKPTQQEDVNTHLIEVPDATPAEPDNDIFETPDEPEPEPVADGDATLSFSQGYDELPIEIQSLMERFLESLALRSRPTSLSMETLSELYQDFYEHAYTHINTHVSALSARMSRDQSPSPSISSARSAQGRSTQRKNSKPLDRPNIVDALVSDTQMLTVSEISNKRKARRNLELSRVAIEEAVERGVCEKVYPRIWRHASTDDEARDEKLRSRAAALNVVGVDLKELLSTALSENVTLAADLNPSEAPGDTSPKALLSNARKSLEDMNIERYPLGKLTHLFAVHKHIVEALQQMFHSASSADEVLPTLIYTIITSPPQSNHIISNFNFIQRFRKSSKIDGEAAYCLTNLEAAITFLETVDLSSIRPQELPEGPARPSSGQSTPRSEIQDPMYRGLPGDTPIPTKPTPSALKTPALEQPRSRSLSNVMASKPRPLEAASDVVMQSADAAFDNIHHALDGGFKFLFGRLREKQTSFTRNSPKAAAPKTLEEARKIVNLPVEPSEDEINIVDNTLSEVPAEPVDDPLSKDSEDQASDPVGVAYQPNSGPIGNKPTQKLQILQSRAVVGTTNSTSQPTTSSSYTAVESMKNLGNTLNPLKGIPGMMRGFGSRSSTPASGVSPPPLLVSPSEQPHSEEKTPGLSLDSVAPPIQRFVELRDPRELNFFDVELLLRDYQRLAGALNAARSS